VLHCHIYCKFDPHVDLEQLYQITVLQRSSGCSAVLPIQMPKTINSLLRDTNSSGNLSNTSSGCSAVLRNQMRTNINSLLQDTHSSGHLTNTIHNIQDFTCFEFKQL
jgi:hypothetical protein